MAVSGNEPISAGNLKAALDGLTGGGSVPETLTCNSSDMYTLFVPFDTSAYKRFEVWFLSEDEPSKYIFYGTFKSTDNSATLESIGDNYSWSTNDYNIEFKFKSTGIEFTKMIRGVNLCARLVGYRF